MYHSPCSPPPAVMRHLLGGGSRRERNVSAIRSESRKAGVSRGQALVLPYMGSEQQTREVLNEGEETMYRRQRPSSRSLRIRVCRCLPPEPRGTDRPENATSAAGRALSSAPSGVSGSCKPRGSFSSETGLPALNPCTCKTSVYPGFTAPALAGVCKLGCTNLYFLKSAQLKNSN